MLPSRISVGYLLLAVGAIPADGAVYISSTGAITAGADLGTANVSIAAAEQ